MKNPEKFRVNRAIPYGTPYLIPHPRTHAKLAVIASCDNGWNHVSVSLENRTPTWDEMCYIKKQFFDDEDMCLQFHPRKSQYVNAHEHCLHIWQPPLRLAFAIEESMTDGL